MKQQEFWEEVEQRVQENKQIVRGGLPQGWARVMSWVGLRFWVVGVLSAVIPTLWLWMKHYQQLMTVVRGMVWR